MIPFSSTYNGSSSNFANLHSFQNKVPKTASSVLRPGSPPSSPAASFSGANTSVGPKSGKEPPEVEHQGLIPEAAVEFFEEDIAEYRPGGYHPVRLGDTLNSKYEIIQKLGFGKFSTTWLAIDKTVERSVALKILKANSNGIETDIHEQETLKYANSNDPTHLIGLLERFTHKGPNGDHVCLVFWARERDGGDGKVTGKVWERF